MATLGQKRSSASRRIHFTDQRPSGEPGWKIKNSTPNYMSTTKSDSSMVSPINFTDGLPSCDPSLKLTLDGPTGWQSQTKLDSIFQSLEENIITFAKKELKRFHKVLSLDFPECLVSDYEEQRNREAFLKITVDFLKMMNQTQLAEHLQSRSTSAVCQRKLKSNLQQKFSCVFEGIAKAGKPTRLNQIFTELYMTEGGAAGVNDEHEVRQNETASRKPSSQKNTITSEEIFKGPTQRQAPVRTVLTKGIAGIGKTMLTQKFSLDWAEDRANQDIQFLFPFTFRELNVLRDQQFSLVGLVHHFFSETKGLCSFNDLQVVFILDGLDESQFPLDFIKTQFLTDATESSLLNVLLVNLIRGTLLPFARLWITTRTAAATQIPAECISMVTEVQGFADTQKEQYFRKRFRNKQAKVIISHIKTCRSLYIMCHMPVFCWIAATVLVHLLKTRSRDKLPKTLTEMYIHYLVVQIKVNCVKYNGCSVTAPLWNPATKKMVESLGKFAFEQLQKKQIFYESDLRECGFDATAASMFSGVFTQVFTQETALHQDMVYCFVHLSVQEFLAALHVHQTFTNTGVNLLSVGQPSFLKLFKENPKLKHLHQAAIDQALESPNGHLDLFLRFLLGLSLPTNQILLRGLLKPTQGACRKKAISYIQKKISEDLPAERYISLFHCLNELNDHSLVEQIQQYMSSGRLSKRTLSPAEWSALVFFLLSSHKNLEVFDLTKYLSSETGFLKLLPVVKASRTANLGGCNLSIGSCSALASVLSSQSSSLRHLELNNNPVRDSGVELLCSGLKSPNCRLDTLRLCVCDLSGRSCRPLASVLRCKSSSIRHLDLSNNCLCDSGIERLCFGLKSPLCILETLRLSGCLVSEEGGASLASALRTSSHLRELDLSYNHPGLSTNHLTALLEDPHCPLNTLRLEPAEVRWLTPGLRKYFCELTLDPDSKKHNSKTFQVLCRPGLTGRSYWEVDWRINGSGGVDIAVSYSGAIQKEDSDFGLNDQSWCLRASNGVYSVSHNKEKSTVYTFPTPFDSVGRVAVYVDWPAGSLSYYIVSSTGLIHIYTFKTTFTEPLFAGFGWSPDSSVSLVDELKKAHSA